MQNEELQEALKRGEMLPVMEAFYTLQGEGYYTGQAAYFIRLGGCDVGCHWCDVKESWNPDIHPARSAEQVAREAAAASDTIVLTGGEPAMWNLDILTGTLHELGCRIHIETSGAYSLTGHIDWVCLSPKKNQLPVPEMYDKADELKVIIYNQNDFVFAEEQAAKVRPGTRLFLQSEWSRRERMYPAITEYILSHPKWRAGIQTHKYLNIP